MQYQWKTLLFGGVRAKLNKDSVEFEYGESCSVQELREQLKSVEPELAPFLEHAKIARNHEYVEGEETLKHTDELAVIPPVCGG